VEDLNLFKLFYLTGMQFNFGAKNVQQNILIFF